MLEKSNAPFWAASPNLSPTNLSVAERYECNRFLCTHIKFFFRFSVTQSMYSSVHFNKSFAEIGSDESHIISKHKSSKVPSAKLPCSLNPGNRKNPTFISSAVVFIAPVASILTPQVLFICICIDCTAEFASRSASRTIKKPFISSYLGRFLISFKSLSIVPCEFF